MDLLRFAAKRNNDPPEAHILDLVAYLISVAPLKVMDISRLHEHGGFNLPIADPAVRPTPPGRLHPARTAD